MVGVLECRRNESVAAAPDRGSVYAPCHRLVSATFEDPNHTQISARLQNLRTFIARIVRSFIKLRTLPLSMSRKRVLRSLKGQSP